MNWEQLYVVFSGLMGGFIGFIGQQVVTNRNLQDSLDSKSGWRKELFEAVSQSHVDLKSIYTLRATLRYKEKDNTNSHLKPFKTFSSLFIIIFGIGLVSNMIVFYLYKKRSFWNPLREYIWRNFDNIFLSATKSSFIAVFLLTSVLSILVFNLLNIRKLKKELGEKENKDGIIEVEEKSDKDKPDKVNEKRELKFKPIKKGKIEVRNLEKDFEGWKEDEIKKVPLYVFNFDSMTKTIIDFCDECTNHDWNQSYFPWGNEKKFRLYTRYMLKHHWEELSVPNYRFIKKLEVRKRNNEAIRDTIITVLGEDKTSK